MEDPPTTRRAAGSTPRLRTSAPSGCSPTRQREIAPALGRQQASAFLDSLAETGIELGADQAAAVHGVLTSSAAVETLVGPAGTGKSFVVGALAKAWQDPDVWDGEQREWSGSPPARSPPRYSPTKA
jgi:hypothetical protein